MFFFFFFFFFFYNRLQSPDQVARMRRLILAFAVLMGRSDSSHAAVLFSNRQQSPDQAADAQAHTDIRCSIGTR